MLVLSILFDEQVEQIRKEAKAHKDVIAQSKASITNIDQSVDSINRWLGVLGLKGFVLVREEGVVPQYRLQRPDQRSLVDNPTANVPIPACSERWLTWLKTIRKAKVMLRKPARN